MFTGGAKLSSKFFKTFECSFGQEVEQLIRGGRSLFPQVKAALDDVKQIGVIGWASQGPAQAQNLRDTLNDAQANTKVVVGLRANSASMPEARAKGFTEENGSLQDMWQVIRESDMVLLLISDSALVDIHDKVFASMKPGATLGLSHGFLLGHLQSQKKALPDHVDVVLVAPKGFGKSVRRLYEQGATVDGAGINSSFAVHQDVSGKALERTIAWGVGIGSPYMFPTTMHNEWKSDIFGERTVLCGGLWGISEFMYRHYVDRGATPAQAFKRSCDALTGPITQKFSKLGLLGYYEGLTATNKTLFEIGYSGAYHPMREVAAEIYDEVASGRELGSVVDHSRRMTKDYPLTPIDTTLMWQAGKEVKGNRSTTREDDPTSAGVYAAAILAQCDELFLRDHTPSEIVNESIIEALDSLNPYVDAKGMDFMINNCSVTAKLGARKWAPRVDYLLSQQAGPKIDQQSRDEGLIKAFRAHRIHNDLRICAEFRPPVDIAVVE